MAVKHQVEERFTKKFYSAKLLNLDFIVRLEGNTIYLGFCVLPQVSFPLFF